MKLTSRGWRTGSVIRALESRSCSAGFIHSHGRHLCHTEHDEEHAEAHSQEDPNGAGGASIRQ
jgi:hypothetical protein